MYEEKQMKKKKVDGKSINMIGNITIGKAMQQEIL